MPEVGDVVFPSKAVFFDGIHPFFAAILAGGGELVWAGALGAAFIDTIERNAENGEPFFFVFFI